MGEGYPIVPDGGYWIGVPPQPGLDGGTPASQDWMGVPPWEQLCLDRGRDAFCGFPQEDFFLVWIILLNDDLEFFHRGNFLSAQLSKESDRLFEINKRKKTDF